MKCQSFRFLVIFFMIVGCSPAALQVERAIAPGTLTVIQLSDRGAIGQILDQLSLTEAIAGPSDIVVQEDRVYIASYKLLLIAEENDNGKLRLLSSLPLSGYDTALALHSTANVVYIVNTEGLQVVDVGDPTQPKQIEHLRLADELAKLNLPNPLKDPIGTDIGCEDNKLVLTLQGEGESPNPPRAIIPSRAGIAAVFDVAEPHSPRIERVLDPLAGAAVVEMGLYRHQVFVAGDELVEYQDFERGPGTASGLWLKTVEHPDGQLTPGAVPGDVIDMKFVMGSREDWETGKTEAIIKQYRHANPQERREFERLTPLDQGVVFIATANAVVSLSTSHKWISWRLRNNRTASDRFGHLYGIDAYGYFGVYVAAGTKGVYGLKWDGEVEFWKRDHLETLPGPALDVAVSGDRLYVLCGELGLRNVQHNADLIADQKK
ncbi:hypothetical protein C6502_22170 [Candidatus Poribacteria bacterium]|nr:MAG: hypothetical protein C6502_22170 [Candidatus Poribacteria bacterium]